MNRDSCILLHKECKSLEASDNLPDPDVIALYIVEDLEAAPEQFREIMTDLSGKKCYKYTTDNCVQFLRDVRYGLAPINHVPLPKLPITVEQGGQRRRLFLALPCLQWPRRYAAGPSKNSSAKNDPAFLAGCAFREGRGGSILPRL